MATNVSDAEVELIVGLKPDVDADAGDSLKEAEEHRRRDDRQSVDLHRSMATAPTPMATSSPDHYAAGAKGDIVLVDALT